MTDNEKRAHDLAIASIPFLFSATKNTKHEDNPFDLYAAYLSTYNEVLKAFNRDFPD